MADIQLDFDPLADYPSTPIKFFFTETGPSTLTVDGSGGVQVSGSAPVVYPAEFGSGGVQISGLAGAATTYIEEGAGGVAISGDAILANSYTEAGAGGIAVSGSSPAVLTAALRAIETMVGGTVLGGAAAESFYSPLAIYVASGGAKVGGSAAVAGILYAEAAALISASSPGDPALIASVNADALLDASTPALGGLILSMAGDSAIEMQSAEAVAVFMDAAGVSLVSLSTPNAALGNFQLSATALVSVLSGIQFVADFTDGWAYNLKTGAPSFYEGMRFNSFAMIDGEYYGANESGIHRLGACSDGGTEIDATLTLGTSRLDSDAIKSVPAVYLGGKSAEPMLLTCRVEGQEYSYEFSHAVAVTGVAKAKPGRGLKGVYWGIEIANQRGGDAEIDTLEVLTAPTSRRV